jgi:hypothetical protein
MLNPISDTERSSEEDTKNEPSSPSKIITTI